MNSIKQKISEITKPNKVHVIVGSHKLQINVNPLTTSLELIARSLQQCKIQNFNSYELFENVYGIERQVPKSAFVHEYVTQWPDKNCCFRVRKNLSNNRLIENIEKTKQIRSKLFEISRQISSIHSIQEEHIYEDVKESSLSNIRKSKTNKLNKIKLKNNFKKLFNDLKLKRFQNSSTSDSSTLMFILNEVNFDSTI